MINHGVYAYFFYFEDEYPTTFQDESQDLALAVQNSEQAEHDLGLAVQSADSGDNDMAFAVAATETGDFDLALTVQAVSLLAILLGIQETDATSDHDLALTIEAAGVTVDASLLLAIRNDERMTN